MPRAEILAAACDWYTLLWAAMGLVPTRRHCPSSGGPNFCDSFKAFLQVFAQCLFSQSISRAEEQQLHPRHRQIPRAPLEIRIR